MSVHREPYRVTPDEAHAHVGKRFDYAGESVILIKVKGSSALIRYAGSRGHRPRGASSHYAWTSVSSLLRREDMDNYPHPDWLQQALDSPRPPRDLHDVIQSIRAPQYTQHALEQERVASAGAALVADLQYISYAHNRLRSPHVDPERWASVFENWRELEARFAREGYQEPRPRTWTLE